MADDHRYDWLEDWLDDDAVERLLNGSPAAGPVRDSAAADEDMTAEPADDAPANGAVRDGSAAGTGATAGGSAAGAGSAVRDGAAPDSTDRTAGAASGAPGGRAGSPAPDGAPVPAEAERLVAALRELVPPPAVDGVPLSGEEAALAAFREARAATATSATAATATAATATSVAAAAAPVAPEPAPEPEPSVRLGVLAAPRRRLFSRWQPVKAALAMALAGCAIGGVAVAAGAGVLPAPFGRAGGEPAAAPSVSAFGDDPAGGVSPDGRRVPGASPSRGRDGGPSGSGTPDGSGSSAPGAGRSRTPGERNEPAGSPSASPRPGKSGGKDDTGRGDSAKPGTAWAVRMCRDYLDAQKNHGNAVDEDDVRTLERAAGIGSAVDLRAFCERLVKADDAARSGAATGAGGLTGGRTGSVTGGDAGDTGIRDGGVNGVFRLVPPVRSSTGFGAPAPGVTFSDPAAL
ncbi:hypothetical protein [Streptomyces roseoverticillatus]|uniref:hypothetical protein n=1 Tax=Streptomyces roseoverticillatus TaxID=66429 RepID=UPI0004C1BB1F|nr:hypothetical protein [Streptomyces roseoverticillatus]